MKKSTPRKVLLIEDDPAQVMMYEVSFHDSEFAFLFAKNGQEGIALAKSEKPDLILLDLLLGDINGMEVLQKLKADRQTSKIKVVVMTNYSKRGLDEECRQAGAAGFLIKSEFMPQEIVGKVREILK